MEENKMPKAKISDINNYYEIHGKGEPIVVIWGMGGEIPKFVHHLTNQMSKKFKIIFFDSRGTGRTDKPDHPYSFEMMAEDTVLLMDVLGVKSAHILGISMGSRIALAIAAKYPEKVKSLILNVAAARSTHNDDPQAANSYKRLYAAMTQPKFLETRSEHLPTFESFLRQFKALKTFDGRDMLGKIKSPTLIVNGTKDDSTPVKFAIELSEGIHNSRLILIEEDHLFIRNNPDLLIKPVLRFLDEIDVKN
jgi:pimeloyl-ACP methyl ester carboxylesterase